MIEINRTKQNKNRNKREVTLPKNMPPKTIPTGEVLEPFPLVQE